MTNSNQSWKGLIMASRKQKQTGGGILALILIIALIWAPWNKVTFADPGTETPVATTAPATTEVPTTATPTVNPTANTGTSAGAAPATTVTTSNPTNGTTSTGWTINKIDVASDPIIDAWLNKLKEPAPTFWTTFPNIPNPDVSEFDVANGMEYGVDNVPFCQQDSRCDFVVPAQHYRLITADYSFQGMTCQSADGTGCLLLLINVGDQSFTWRNQMADNGFTVVGRYWNGDALDEGVWGLVSNVSANMLNMPTVSHPGEALNDGVMTNGGANCGIPTGCKSVDITVVVHAGDRILAVAKTTVNR